MTYTAWSVSYGEQPSSAKWNLLGANDASFNDGTGLPVGTCVQVAQNVTTAAATGTTIIPFDDTIPQNTEGDQYMTQAITPRSATNLLVIDSLVVCSHTATASTQTAAIFQDSAANALAVGSLYIGTASAMMNIRVTHTMTAGTTSSTTFKVRVGSSNAGTTTFNGAIGNRYFGATSKSSIIIREYTV